MVYLLSARTTQEIGRRRKNTLALRFEDNCLYCPAASQQRVAAAPTSRHIFRVVVKTERAERRRKKGLGRKDKLEFKYSCLDAAFAGRRGWKIGRNRKENEIRSTKLPHAIGAIRSLILLRCGIMQFRSLSAQLNLRRIIMLLTRVPEVTGGGRRHCRGRRRRRGFRFCSNFS